MAEYEKKVRIVLVENGCKSAAQSSDGLFLLHLENIFAIVLGNVFVVRYKQHFL